MNLGQKPPMNWCDCSTQIIGNAVCLSDLFGLLVLASQPVVIVTLSATLDSGRHRWEGSVYNRWFLDEARMIRYYKSSFTQSICWVNYVWYHRWLWYSVCGFESTDDEKRNVLLLIAAHKSIFSMFLKGTTLHLSYSQWRNWTSD